MYQMKLTRNFYTMDGTTQLTMNIICDYACSMVFTADQGSVIAEFKSKRKMNDCAAEILNIVSGLMTGDVNMSYTGEFKV